MAAHDLITLEGEHGQYQTRVAALDLMITRYLPASVNGLQTLIRERQGDESYKIGTVAEGLMILAELDGHATN
jgi:hypothetical protein